MPKMSVLDMVQEILSDMNSDNVNSITDTAEAMQVATIIKRAYFNILNDRLWPTTGKLFTLTPSADAARPTHMRIEEDVTHVEWVKYNTARVTDTHPTYTTIDYKQPREFLAYTMGRDNTRSNVETVIDYHGTPLFILNDAAPSYYTSFDDKYLVFDSFDNAVDSTLMASKTQVFGEVEPTWVMEDGFIPELPSKAFPYLISESKSVASLKIKELFSQKDEQASGRQKAWLARHKRQLDGGIRYPDYGRKSTSGGRYSRAGYRDDHFTG